MLKWCLLKLLSHKTRPQAVTAVLEILLADAGWDVRGGVMKIWAGERDMDNILVDKDAGSAIALKTVMQYALKFEQDFGAKAS